MTAPTVVDAPRAVERVVRIGLATYRNEHNYTTYGLMGTTVFVHPADVERFDAKNVAPKIAALLDPLPSIEDVRPPTAAEKRIMDGFGDKPITAEAQMIALAAAEQGDEFAAATREREIQDRVAETLRASSIEAEVQRRVEAELARRVQEGAGADPEPEPARVPVARKARG